MTVVHAEVRRVAAWQAAGCSRTRGVAKSPGVCIAVLLAALCAFGDEAEPRSGGRLDLPSARATFRPVAYAADWTRRDGVGGALADATGRRSFVISDEGKPLLDGRAEFRAEAGAVVATWQMTAVRDWCGKGVYVTAELPVDAYPDGELTADARTVALNGGGHDPTLFYGRVSKVKLSAAHGGRLLEITFANPIWVRLQDNRKWRGKTYSLRLYLGGEKLSAGEALSLTCRMSTASPLSLPQPTTERIEAGANWVPVRVAADVQPGSALDFSRLCGSRRPAGTFGRVIRRGGHFEFDGMSGVAQRFYGVNLCGSAVTPKPDEAKSLADRLVRMGYNAVRIHHHESALTDDADGFRLDEERMCLFRGFVDACTERGIYLTTDLFVSRGPISRRSIGENREGCVDTGEYKELVLFHEGAFSNYLAWARQFLGHVHPVTGRRLAEEPALAWLSLVNEGNLGNNGMRWMREYPVVAELWRTWLAERRREEPAVWRDIPDELPIRVSLDDDRSVHLAAFTVFMGELERRFVTRVKKFLRDEMRCPALVTDMNSWRYPAAYQLPRRECLDFADEHHYYDHPEFDGGRWQMPSRCGNENPFLSESRGAPDLVVRRILGQPFVVSEYGYCAPSAYRSAGGLLFGALAALQDWSGVWRFAWSHGPQGVTAPESKRTDFFDLTGDPLAMATERAAICLFLRGDLAPLPDTFALRLDPARLRRPDVPAPIAAVRWPWLAWRAKIGCALADSDAAGAQTLGDSPDVFAKSSEDVCGAVRVATADAVSVDATNGSFAVVSPRTCGVFAECGRVSAGLLDVELAGARATVWASSLDGRPLAVAERILVVHVTDLLDADTRFGDGCHKTLLRWGRLPHLMRNGSALIRLGLKDGRHRVYALDPDGARRREVAADSRPDGTLIFTAEIGRDPASASWLYEITKEK